MPIVAVAGAVAGASALAAGGLSVFGTIAAIGGIVSGIGAITGNDTLMKLGAVAGLAGGVGAFAQGKGWLASGSAAGTAAEAATSTSNIQQMTQTAAPGVDAAQNIGQAAGGAELGTAGLEQTSQLSQNITGANQLAGATEPANGLFDTVSDGAFNAAKDSQAANLAMGADAINGYREGGGIFDTLKGFGKFMKENKELTSLAGNFIGGMFDDEKKAKAEYYKSAADISKQKMANASAIPDMGFKLKQSGPIWKPTAPTYNGPRPGLFHAR